MKDVPGMQALGLLDKQFCTHTCTFAALMSSCRGLLLRASAVFYIPFHCLFAEIIVKRQSYMCTLTAVQSFYCLF